MEDINYGKNNKRIIFTDTDHRHSQLILKLKTDGLTQAKFFRCLISGYLADDRRLRDFIIENSDMSKAKKKDNRKLYKEGQDINSNLGLSSEQVDDIFDLISGEFPEL